MANVKLQSGLAVAVASLAIGAAHAQIRPAYGFPPPALTPTTGLHVPDTGIYFNPYVGFGAGYDDNLFTSNVLKKSSPFYALSPGFRLTTRTESSVFQGSYQAQIGRYTDSSNDDYVDHVAHAQFDTAFSGRSFVRLGYDYVRGHDPRGSTDRGISLYPDKYELSSPSITYAYGAPGAQGRVELYASDGDKKYLNNRASTASSDRDTLEYGGAFYWRVAPKTYVLAEARETRIDYKLPASPQDSKERRYYGGVSWEATAATTGTLKVGQLRRSFDNGSYPTTSDTSWEGSILWAPRTYSTFDFYTSRQTSESTGVGRFLLTSVAGVTWNHAWNSYFNSAVMLRYQKDEFQGVNRVDETRSLGFRVGYKFHRTTTFGAEYTYTQRDSNQPQFEYDKNFYLLTATVAM
jgi:hypothetical protein